MIVIVMIVGNILGLYRDNGQENGNYYNIVGHILGSYRKFWKNTDDRKSNNSFGAYGLGDTYWGLVGNKGM